MNNAIVYLTENTEFDINNLVESLSKLKNNFLNQYHYPIIVFHEGLSDHQKNTISSIYDVSFEKICFEIPDFLPQSIRSDIHEHLLGYRHMCRFFAGDIFRHPAINDLDFIWRLDTDSFIEKPIGYDVFESMLDYIYGYIVIFNDQPSVSDGLLASTQEFLKTKCISPCQNIDGWNRECYYTNFEIISIKKLITDNYMEYFDYIDRTGNFFYKRWGDHIFRYLAIKIFHNDESIKKFTNIKYRHQVFST